MDEPEPLYSLWIYNLVPRIKFGKLLSAFVIFAVIWSILDIIAGQSSNNIKLFFAAMCAYIVPIYAMIVDRSISVLDGMAATLKMNTEEQLYWRRRFTHRSARWITNITIISLVMWLLHISMVEFSYGRSPLDIFRYQQYSAFVGSLLVWLTMTTAISALSINALTLAELGKLMPVDLLRGSTHLALARVAVISTLSIIGAQMLFVLLVTDAASTWIVFVPGFVITTIPLLTLFLIPLWPIHRRLKEVKHRELQAIDAQLVQLRPQANIDLNDHRSLDQLNRLLSYRREIKLASEWPFDVPALIRLGLYLILPPMTWVGAALIENVVDALL